MNRSLPWMCCFSFLMLLCAPWFTLAGDAGKDLPGFLEGYYGLIGKRPGTGDTYSGTATIRVNGDKLEILRCVGHSRISGQGSVIFVTSDRIPSLGIRWRDGNHEYRGRYDIHGDADNYARLSGPYVAMEDETKFGWELLYVDSNDGPVCR